MIGFIVNASMTGLLHDLEGKVALTGNGGVGQAELFDATAYGRLHAAAGTNKDCASVFYRLFEYAHPIRLVCFPRGQNMAGRTPGCIEYPEFIPSPYEHEVRFSGSIFRVQVAHLGTEYGRYVTHS